ncbi:MAG: oxaloacetate decarboxylase, partial [Propionibacteriaceae bacterium]|jgi:methylmalonyl-CoA carboxyltransferase 5S subunit|nr:oxaloacetate decarboxylase [Propionibacteriaceae bacterium]
MFPAVAPDFFKHRAEGPKSVAKSEAQLAAEKEAAASGSTTAAVGAITYNVAVGGRTHTVKVERA